MGVKQRDLASFLVISQMSEQLLAFYLGAPRENVLFSLDKRNAMPVSRSNRHLQSLVTSAVQPLSHR